MSIEKELDGRFRNEYHKALINLVYTAGILHGDFERKLKKYRLTPQQYNVLKVLRGFGPEPLTVDFIRKRMLDKSSDVSRIIDRLVKKGLVKRSESKEDRRSKNLTILQKGLKLLDRIDPVEKEVDLLMKGLTKKEVKELNFLLDKARTFFLSRQK